MPQWAINVGGVYNPVKQPFVNVAGTWTPIQQGWVNVAGTWQKFFQLFTGPVQHLYTVAGTYNEVIPIGSSLLFLDIFASSGAGGGGFSNINGNSGGGGGSSGGMSQSSLIITPAMWGQSINFVLGLAGTPSTQFGGASTVTAGLLPAIATAPGNHGGNASGLNIPGIGAAPNTPNTGGTVANVNGNSGVTGQNNTQGGQGGAGAPGVTGAHASGAAAGSGSSFNVPGGFGGDGVASFWYT